MSSPLPAIFLGHGNPLNALRHNDYTKAWRQLGRDIPTPSAVLAISAHWYVSETAVTISTAPRTIHDFGGFPPELYKIQYAAPGDPELARRVQQLLAPLAVNLNDSWGLDHGTWSVLLHVYPDANIPIVQLSIDMTQPAAFHYDIGKKLAALRNENILIVGSGNLVHNLRAYAWDGQPREPYDWAVRFENTAKELMLEGDHKALIDYVSLGSDATRSIPTPDHYLPLLYVLGTQKTNEPVQFPIAGMDGGSISMLAVQVG